MCQNGLLNILSTGLWNEADCKLQSVQICSEENNGSSFSRNCGSFCCPTGPTASFRSKQPCFPVFLLQFVLFFRRQLAGPDRYSDGNHYFSFHQDVPSINPVTVIYLIVKNPYLDLVKSSFPAGRINPIFIHRLFCGEIHRP